MPLLAGQSILQDKQHNLLNDIYSQYFRLIIIGNMSQKFSKTSSNPQKPQKLSEFETGIIADQWEFYKVKKMDQKRGKMLLMKSEDDGLSRMEEEEMRMQRYERLNEVMNMLQSQKRQMMNVIQAQEEKKKLLLLEVNNIARQVTQIETQVKDIDKQMIQARAQVNRLDNQNLKIEFRRERQDLMKKLDDVKIEQELWQEFLHPLVKERSGTLEQKLTNIGEEISQRQYALQNGLNELNKKQKQMVIHAQ